MKRTLENFATQPALPWRAFLKGNGSLESTGHSLRFANTDTTAKQYTNAQIDDYQGLRRRNYLWCPPLQMTVRARFSHRDGELSGTAGFGFWNDPFLMTGLSWPALPRAIWFFYSSPPSNMKLDLHTPGFGWKAATIDALRWQYFALAPLIPIAVPLMNIRPLYQLCWPLAQRAINVSEALLSVTMTDWHTYDLIWQKNQTIFQVDGRTILDCQTTLRGPLGFVMWFDNQYLVITPWGRFRWGLLASPGQQWLEVDRLEIANL